MSDISVHVIIFFLSNFPIIVFNIYIYIYIYIYTYIFLIFTFLQPFSLPYLFISFLLLQHFSLIYLFISPLPSTLISLFLFPFIFLYFYLFLFTPAYYKFATISSILYIVFPHKKGTLSLSLSQFFGGFFYYSCIPALG